MSTQKPLNPADDSKQDTRTEEDDVINFRSEVLITVGLSIVAGETYPQIEADLREVGVCISTTEVELATSYVILFLRDTLGNLPDDVADFCARAELPFPRDLFLELAHNFPPVDKMRRH